MPANGEINGTKEVKKLPYGYNYEELILELWYIKKG